MKHKQTSGLKILTFSLAMPLLIFSCVAVSLLSYLAFSSLGLTADKSAPDSGPVRIRTIPELETIPPEPVTEGPDLAEVIEEREPEPVIEIEASPVVEAPAEPALGTETLTTSSPVEEARTAPETVPLDTAAADEDTAAVPENGTSPQVEDLSMVEAAAEPIVAEPVQPEIAANPAPPPKKDPPAPAAPSEPTFVPDSSFFDQLLEQVD